MKTTNLNNLGVLELMQILHELHKLGYQKLRWISCWSPNGFYLRCFITTQDHIILNRNVDLDECADEVWYTSAGTMTTGEDITPLISQFIDENPRLLEIGKGIDPDYVEWFEKLLSQAQQGIPPEFYGEYWSLPMGKIKVGKTTIPSPPTTMRLISWNIDGIKAHFDALLKLVDRYNPEIICLQKVKDSKDSTKFEIPGYKRACNSAPYAGVVTYVKNCIPCTFVQPLEPVFSGHLLKTEFVFPAFTLFNVYTPYSNQKLQGAVEHRQKFDECLLDSVRCTPDRIVICGDMNIVASEMDCWDGKYKRKQANFHDWERYNFMRLLSSEHLIDTYRSCHPFSRNFSYFFKNDPLVRANNQGHRIDYFLASRSFEPQILNAEIIKDCTASTNNPIILDIRY